MKLNKIKWGPVLIILLAVNLLFLGWMFFNPPGPRPPLPPVEFIAGRLDFTSEQRQQLAALDQQLRQRVRPKRDSIQQLRASMINDISINNLRLEEISRRTERIGRLQAEVEQLTMAHFLDIRAICDKPQQEQFDRFIKEMIRRRRPEPIEHR